MIRSRWTSRITEVTRHWTTRELLHDLLALALALFHVSYPWVVEILQVPPSQDLHRLVTASHYALTDTSKGAAVNLELTLPSHSHIDQTVRDPLRLQSKTQRRRFARWERASEERKQVTGETKIKQDERGDKETEKDFISALRINTPLWFPEQQQPNSTTVDKYNYTQILLTLQHKTVSISYQIKVYLKERWFLCSARNPDIRGLQMSSPVSYSHGETWRGNCV